MNCTLSTGKILMLASSKLQCDRVKIKICLVRRKGFIVEQLSPVMKENQLWRENLIKKKYCTCFMVIVSRNNEYLNFGVNTVTLILPICS